LFRQALNSIGGPARCPRLALGHPELDPLLHKDASGRYDLRHIANLVRGLFKPRKVVAMDGPLAF
jgi:hypothetical protein